jgi:hypothetical protein
MNRHIWEQKKKNEKIDQGSNNSKLIVMTSCRSNVLLSYSLYLNI